MVFGRQRRTTSSTGDASRTAEASAGGARAPRGLRLNVAGRILVLGLGLLLQACAAVGDPPVSQAALDAYLADKPEPLRILYARVLLGGRRDLVLNHMHAGLAAMDMGEFELAEQSFDEATRGIEAVYAHDPSAARARSLWHEEGTKDFKGEPYERVMAYCYRGLLYMRRGDFENARACFKGGALQDAFAEEEQHRCDFALMSFLEGWASQCLGDGDLAQTAYQDVQRLRPDFTLPPPDHNTLILAETGRAPRKLALGEGQHELVCKRGVGFTEEKARVTVNEKTEDAYPMEDVAWQAMTRGGRPIDKILQGHVVFRRTNEQMGTALTGVAAAAAIAGAHSEDHRDELLVTSAAAGVIGVTQLLIASKVQTRADTRAWKNLPDAVHVLTCRTDPSGGDVTIHFLDASGNEIVEQRREGAVFLIDGRNGMVWVRSRSAVPIQSAGNP